MTDERDPAERFIADMQYVFELEWWTSIRLQDCGELVYRHAVINCRCGRNQSAAYRAWREQNPDAAAAHDRERREEK